MKIFVICDNNDTLTGLRLAGIDGKIVNSSSEASMLFDELCKNDDIGIILIEENIAQNISNIIDEIRTSKSKPLIVEIPDRHGFSRKKDFITSYINDSIGVKL